MQGKARRVRDMLVAEGFEVSMSLVRRPHTLLVYSNSQRLWSFGIWKQLPRQDDLAILVRQANNGK